MFRWVVSLACLLPFCTSCLLTVYLEIWIIFFADVLQKSYISVLIIDWLSLHVFKKTDFSAFFRFLLEDDSLVGYSAMQFHWSWLIFHRSLLPRSSLWYPRRLFQHDENLKSLTDFLFLFSFMPSLVTPPMWGCNIRHQAMNEISLALLSIV
jgi:hypothetical protein